MIDPLLDLVHVYPPPSAEQAAARQVAFEAAWEASESAIAMLLSLEHPSREHERAAVCAVVQALDGAGLGGRGVARAADLARRDRGGTLGTYDGFAFDRARAVAARAAVWERREATPDQLRAACAIIRAAVPTPRFVDVAAARALDR